MSSVEGICPVSTIFRYVSSVSSLGKDYLPLAREKLPLVSETFDTWVLDFAFLIRFLCGSVWKSRIGSSCSSQKPLILPLAV